MKMKMMNEQIDISVPDPAWDYAEIWPQFHKLKARIEDLIKFVAEQEKSSPGIDIEISEGLHHLIEHAQHIKYLLNSDPLDRSEDDDYLDMPS